MSRRAKIRLISYSAAILIGVIAALAACHVGAGGYLVRLDAQMTRSFGEALGAVERLDQSLKKCAFVSDRSMESALCAQIYSDAQCTETALSSLPVELDALEDLSKHISVLGDYAFTLSRTAEAGNSFSEETLQQLSSFSNVTTALQQQLEILRQSYLDGSLVHESRRRLLDSLDNLEEETAEKTETLDHAFHRLKGEIPSLEPLVYDGQYCENRTNYLESFDSVAQSEALDKAADFLNISSEDLKSLDSSQGEIPCWRFTTLDGSGVIAVTVHGGFVMRYLSDQVEADDNDREASVNACKTFLEAHGYTNMVEANDASDTTGDAFCFVPVQEEVICLPDRVVLRVDPSSGELTAFDASGYLRYHHERSFDKIDLESLRSSLPQSVTPESSRAVLLLSPGGQECVCAEFRCKTEDGVSAIVDVNAETGKQQRILLEGESERNIH